MMCSSLDKITNDKLITLVPRLRANDLFHLNHNHLPHQLRLLLSSLF